MPGLNPKNELQLKLNTEELTPKQVRLIKAMHALIANVVTADDEGEYFETSAQLMKKAAELIKHSSFAENNPTINYAEQAVEYAVDFLQDALDENNLGNIDN